MLNLCHIPAFVCEDAEIKGRKGKEKRARLAEEGEDWETSCETKDDMDRRTAKDKAGKSKERRERKREEGISLSTLFGGFRY